MARLNSIKAWPKQERPREMLLEKGPAFVSDAGLVAILLRTGVQGKDAVALARELIGRFKGLGGLLNATPESLGLVNGLGDAKVAQLLAVFEIAKRALKEEIKDKTYIQNQEDVQRYLSLSMRDLAVEFFKVIFLNQAHGIIGIEDLFRGTINEAAVYPRELVKRALEVHAAAVILVHNHPSGNPSPSSRDIELTRRLSAACRAVDIRLLDHLLIAGKDTVSLIQDSSSIHKA